MEWTFIFDCLVARDASKTVHISTGFGRGGSRGRVEGGVDLVRDPGDNRSGSPFPRRPRISPLEIHSTGISITKLGFQDLSLGFMLKIRRLPSDFRLVRPKRLSVWGHSVNPGPGSRLGGEPRDPDRGRDLWLLPPLVPLVPEFIFLCPRDPSLPGLPPPSQSPPRDPFHRHFDPGPVPSSRSVCLLPCPGSKRPTEVTSVPGGKSFWEILDFLHEEN